MSRNGTIRGTGYGHNAERAYMRRLATARRPRTSPPVLPQARRDQTYQGHLQDQGRCALQMRHHPARPSSARIQHFSQRIDVGECGSVSTNANAIALTLSIGDGKPALKHCYGCMQNRLHRRPLGATPQMYPVFAARLVPRQMSRRSLRISTVLAGITRPGSLPAISMISATKILQESTSSALC